MPFDDFTLMRYWTMRLLLTTKHILELAESKLVCAGCLRHSGWSLMLLMMTALEASGFWPQVVIRHELLPASGVICNVCLISVLHASSFRQNTCACVMVKTAHPCFLCFCSAVDDQRALVGFLPCECFFLLMLKALRADCLLTSIVPVHLSIFLGAYGT